MMLPKLLIVGFVISGVSSIPIGMMGMYMLNCMTRYGIAIGLWIGFLAALLDSFYCAIAMMGYSIAVDSPIFQILFQLIALAVLIYLGIRLSTNKIAKKFGASSIDVLYDSLIPKQSLFNIKILSGVVVIACLNPTPLLFWINMSGLLQNVKWMSGNANEIANISAGVGVGSLVTQCFFLMLFHKLERNHPSLPTHLKRFSIAVAVITIVSFSLNIIREVVMFTKHTGL